MNQTSPDDGRVMRAPRLNANDDRVTLTRWLVADHATVVAGEPVAEIETEKATAELPAEIGGTLLQAVAAGAAVAVGAPLAYVGATLAAAEKMRRNAAAPQPASPPAGIGATAKARALAAARGVDLAAVQARGATILERDVARHFAAQAAEQAGPAAEMADDPRLVLVGAASPHQLRVGRDLRAAARAGIFTTLAYRLDLRGPERAIAAEHARGRAVSLLVLLLVALGRTLPQFPALVSLLAGDRVYRYRDVDIAFAARSPAGELFAPVVRRVDRLGVDAIARECARLAKQAMRGKLDAGDLGGACFTVSLIATPNVEAFVALPPPLQTAILALGGTRQEIALTAAGPAARPVATATVTYDHALCDGILVAEFCAALDRALNPEPA
jgi:pyruvate/2-oxoglutarate dehydrogenase complex dihydrolipoamide acyltransferase (E2) component